MYQPYPGGGANPVVTPSRPPIPSSVTNAVRLMFAGAGLTAIGIILNFVSLSALKSTVRSQSPNLTATQVNNFVTAFVVGLAIVGLVGIGLWIWMAFASRAGQNYARIVSSVLFGLDTILLLIGISRTGFQAGSLLSVLTWVAGLGAIILIWRKDSTAYFQPGRPM
jgi:hypothetical protein